jgi:ADP-ribose pyrophosphatase YjhB (NUDIX family)
LVAVVRDNNGRRYPARPVLGVGALILEAGRVLLVERGREPLTGYWSLPGGAVETGERLEAALVREVFEETGLHVTADSIATVFERIMPDAGGTCEYHYVLVDFYCTITGGEPRPGDDSARVEWFPIESLAGLRMTAGTREVIQACSTRPATQPFVTRP